MQKTKKLLAIVLLLQCVSIVSAVDTAKSDNANLLILTSPAYETVVNEYADWKRTIGFQVDVVAEFWNNYATVRSRLDDIYDEKDIDYLLIVGNTNVVPAYYSSIYLNTGAYNGESAYSSKIYSHYTDYNYSTVAGVSGRRVKCGRISAANPTSARAVLQKIKNYEENLPVAAEDSFYSTALHIAYYEDEATSHSDNDSLGYEDYRFLHTTEEIIDKLSADTENSITDFIKVYTKSSTNPNGILHWNNTLYGQGEDVPPTLTFTGTSSDIISALNQGVLYTMYYDHGSYGGWAHPYTTTSSISNLSNGNKLPIVFCCCCNNFQSLGSGSFAEKFLECSTGGAVGLIAASDIILTGLMDVFIERTFNAIWPHEGFWPILGIELQNAINIDSLMCSPAVYRLGDFVMNGLNDMERCFHNTVLNTNGGESDTPRTSSDFPAFVQHMKEIIHIVGDPTMEMYTDAPHEIAEPTVIYANDSIYVDVHGGCATLTLFNKDTKEVISITGEHAVFPCSQDSLYLSTHRHNSNIWSTKVKDIYLQNAIYTDTNSLSARSVNIGNRVTDIESRGNVIFSTGSETVLKANRIKLAPGTTINKGAKLYATSINHTP